MRYSKRKRYSTSRSIGIGLLAVCMGLYWLYAQYGIKVLEIGILLVLLIIGGKFTAKYLKKQKYLNSGIRQIDAMTGEEFEELLKAHFEKLGYHVSLTPASNDYGADLILKRDGEITAVQAKRYQAKVGNSAIQEIVAAKSYYKANKAMVCTNSYFTSNAKALAFANNVELWDRNTLIDTFKIGMNNEKH